MGLKIGFDAKRAFKNHRGLGNYSRDTIRLLTQQQDENSYFLFTPATRNVISFPYNDICTKTIAPQGIYSHSMLTSLWRTSSCCKDIKRLGLDIYHGLSHELPYGIEKSGVRSVVTMHDVIFLKNPELFPFLDRYSFKKKYTHGCKIADRIIAISEQTKQDLIEYMGEDENRIDVVYQGCNPIFHQPVSEASLNSVREKYRLPSQFMLIVCAIERRKNHELILKAMRHPGVTLPLVIVGRSSEYQKYLQSLLIEYKLENRVIFLNDVVLNDLPALYKSASLFIYPSFFEGFGIPILESLTIGTPVITSKGSCFEETGGNAAQYVSSQDEEELAEMIVAVLGNEDLRTNMISEGFLHADRFSDESIAENLMAVYRLLI